MLQCVAASFSELLRAAVCYSVLVDSENNLFVIFHQYMFVICHQYILVMSLTHMWVAYESKDTHMRSAHNNLHNVPRT